MEFGGLKVLMVSSDRNIFSSGSAVSERMKEYGKLVEELHIVVLCDKSHTSSLRIENGKLKIAPNVYVYPTNSSTKYLRPMDAATIGKNVVLKNKFVRGLSLVTAQDPFECGWAGLRVAKRWRLPLEVQLHTDPFSPYFNGVLNGVRKMMWRRIVREADSIRAVNGIVAEKLVSQFKLPHNKISVLPIYVDQEKIKNTPIEFDIHSRYPWAFIILIASRLTPEKNLPLAFEILRRVRERHENVGMVIAGSGPEEGRLKSLVKNLNLEGAVEFVGWQSNLNNFYKTANIFLQTSFFEGHQLALVEAGLSGLPVVTTPAGIASELENGKEAYVYQLDRPDMFAEGIIDLIENNDKRENLRFNLRKHLEERLLTKGQYLDKMKENWEAVSKNT